MFCGLGADGTVGANKNSIKIIGEETDLHAQGYFVYDSKKSGAVTTSHLRFGKKPDPRDLPDLEGQLRGLPPVRLHGALRRAARPRHRARCSCSTARSARTKSGTTCRARRRRTIVDKKLKFYVIDAVEVARAAGMGGRINTVMQTCFFAISGVLPREEAIAAIKHSIEKTYGKRGESVVRKNFAAVDASLENLHEVKVPDAITSKFELRARRSCRGARVRAQRREPDDVRRRRPRFRSAPCRSTAPSPRPPRSGRSATSPSKFRCGTSQLCIQCGKCVLVCPHAVIRAKVYDAKAINHAPDGFQTAAAEVARVLPT